MGVSMKAIFSTVKKSTFNRDVLFCGYQKLSVNLFNKTSMYSRRFYSFNLQMLYNSVKRNNQGITKRHYGKTFRISDYDCIGFDLDNTLCEYNVESSMKMVYNALSKFLVESRGYPSEVLLKPLTPSEVDFVQRGLIVDTSRGILLRIRGDGVIFRASFGSRLLSDEEICEIYGKDRKWIVTDEFAKNMVAAWNGPLSEKMRTFSDYFDMPASLAIARIIDSKNAVVSSDFYPVWKDVLKGLVSLYNRSHFALDKGEYFSEIKSNPSAYYNKCHPEVIEWLKSLRKDKKLFVVTGSNVDFASHTAEHCLGKDWKELFDFIGFYARKPGFFLGGRPFVKLDGMIEKDSVADRDIAQGCVYSQGNWQTLHKFLEKLTGKDKPKCLYIGDNLIQDVFTVSEFTSCDTVAVAEELAAEFSDHPSKNVINSKFWGSYFSADGVNSSLWGTIIKNHSKICVSGLQVLASKPIDYKFTTFSDETSGYYVETSPVDMLKHKHKISI